MAQDLNNDNIIWTHQFEDELDNMFIQRVQAEVTQSCAIPFALPAERIPAQIIQAAGWFWENVDQAVEERNYVILNKDICKGNKMNKSTILRSIYEKNQSKNRSGDPLPRHGGERSSRRVFRLYKGK